MSKNFGRHTPAFLLLFLVDGPSYGASLLTRLQNDLPYCLSDSAIVYRSLQEMEKNSLVETNWEIRKTGQPRKWYTITPKGKLELEEYAEDIRRRHANLEFFQSYYRTITKEKES
ncbi:PadR family transcripitonal regulator [Candidatus Desulfosporosinus infrequens]|uniref:PadR family transcripitonal regulator n=1 Tax=Candidatus Desulfosporosinus infrequens TaxID=2043169 RepID=A0A2U3JW24_9FIRM|nr:PadR family transcripitonal regulator [Candidatus Desulfosporosinus infrequens]